LRFLQEEEQLIKPAVFGTENVLNAVNAAGTVQRVVITASTASVFTDAFERGEGHVFTEADWNVSATPTKFPYFYSKKLAEQVRLAGERLQETQLRQPGVLQSAAAGGSCKCRSSDVSPACT
jgi:dihydroflavonol-4-reductase